jgi:hypothetical protein
MGVKFFMPGVKGSLKAFQRILGHIKRFNIHRAFMHPANIADIRADAVFAKAVRFQILGTARPKL